MMRLDYQPLSVVTDVGFSRLLQTIEPRYKILSRKYFLIMYCLRSRNTLTQKVAQLLIDVEFLSLTTDIWSTSLSNESLINMTRLAMKLNVRQLFSMHKRSKDHILGRLYVKLMVL